jgi:hypothetical protein
MAEFTFSNQRVSTSMKLKSSIGKSGAIGTGRYPTLFRDNHGKTFLMPRVTGSSVISIVTRTRRTPEPKLFARSSGNYGDSALNSGGNYDDSALNSRFGSAGFGESIECTVTVIP